MRKWSLTFIAMSFLAGMLTGCRSFCHTAGVCDCDFAMDDPCCHRAPWVSGPCLPNYSLDAVGKGGCGNGNCGRGGCMNGGCANGGCMNGGCANGVAKSNTNGAYTNGAAVQTTYPSGAVQSSYPNGGVQTTYPSSGAGTSSNPPARSLIQLMREKVAAKNARTTQSNGDYVTVSGPTSGKEIIAITPPAHAPYAGIPANGFPATAPAPVGALPGGSAPIAN